MVLVSGAAGDIGSATSRQFAAAGFQVLGLDRAAGVSDVEAAGYRGLQLDVDDETAVTEALAESMAMGPLRHVIGIAGGALPIEPRSQDVPGALSAADFRASVEANLVTQYIVLRAALPWLRQSPGLDRSIILTSSFNAIGGWGMPAYSAAKAGLIGMARALTGPLGSEGIRINVVAPGTVRTGRTEAIWAHAPGHFEHLETTTAIGRLATPDDVARAYLALATTLTHVTGEVLVVDGGQSTKRA